MLRNMCKPKSGLSKEHASRPGEKGERGKEHVCPKHDLQTCISPFGKMVNRGM